MPTRDRRAFALQAVRYCLRQDYPQVELIIIDDSTELLRAALPADPRIRYTHSRKPLATLQERQQSAGQIVAHCMRVNEDAGASCYNGVTTWRIADVPVVDCPWSVVCCRCLRVLHHVVRCTFYASCRNAF
jgi:hypothetical protein